MAKVEAMSVADAFIGILLAEGRIAGLQTHEVIQRVHAYRCKYGRQALYKLLENYDERQLFLVTKRNP